jgi:integrase
LSAGAIRTKIARSIWVEGREYVRAPDGHLMIDLRGYEAWVQQTAPPERARRRGA